jgi:putative NADH-flavin reductase
MKFEAQTAVRHIENIMIARTHNDMTENKNIEIMKEDVYEEKCKNIIYDHDHMQFLKRDSDSKKLDVCRWKDKVLHQQLVKLCMRLVHDGHVTSPITF